MHVVTKVKYEREYTLLLHFEDGSVKRVDFRDRLDGKVFEPLRDMALFRTAHLNPDIDTVVWDNGADMSPDYLYEIGMPVARVAADRVAEAGVRYPSTAPGAAKEDP